MDSTTSPATTWTAVCPVSDLEDGDAATLDVDPPVAVFRVDDAFYAIDDTCTHDTYSLAAGYVDGCQVECALHFARYDLRTGAALCVPANGGVRTYPVQIQDGQVFVDLAGRD